LAHTVSILIGGHRWYAFDATQQATTGGFVAIGYGRKAADVAVYNQFGPALYPASIQVSVEPGAAPRYVS
jgi:transglutaminase-like putative cysteine protease